MPKTRPIRPPGDSAPTHHLRYLLMVLGALVVVAAVVTAFGLVSNRSSGSSHDPKTGKPYPLSIPVKKRTPVQKAEGLLMEPVFMSYHHLVAPLNPTLAKTMAHASPSAKMQVRLSNTVPTVSWSTGASWSDTVYSIYATAATNYQIAMEAGSTCMQIKYQPGKPPLYGETTWASSPRVVWSTDCKAGITPGSGWQPSWPAAGGHYPPKSPPPVFQPPTPQGGTVHAKGTKHAN